MRSRYSISCGVADSRRPTRTTPQTAQGQRGSRHPQSARADNREHQGIRRHLWRILRALPATRRNRIQTGKRNRNRLVARPQDAVRRYRNHQRAPRGHRPRPGALVRPAGWWPPTCRTTQPCPRGAAAVAFPQRLRVTEVRLPQAALRLSCVLWWVPERRSSAQRVHPSE
jgi:hypothetical protein